MGDGPKDPLGCTPATEKLVESYKLMRIAEIDPVKLLHVLEDYDEMAERVQQLEDRLRRNEEIDARLSSINEGHKDKGGEIKFYCDPFGNKKANEDALDALKALRVMAGSGVVSNKSGEPKQEA